MEKGESSEKIAIQVSSFAAAHFHPNVQKIPPIEKCAYRLHMYVCLISAGFWRMRRVGLESFFKWHIPPLSLFIINIFCLIELLRALFTKLKISSH